MSTPASLIGVKLGNYELQAVLGRGGMASVYRGLDLNLRRAVAVKVLSAATAAQPDFVERFRQEARLIANLRHPNIVRVYDFGEQAGYIYMVQELLPGPTLEERMGELATRGQRLARADVLAIITQLAAALDAAHAAGIIHRDIKPANAMWNAEGALVLTDFGIAKNLLNTSGHTQAGMVIGTPNYLSPEQAQGVPPTRASDIYSLGVVLYELISGQTPFGGATTMRIVLDHIQTPPPPLRPQRPDLPAAVEAVVNRALAKDPARRFGSAGELARALGQAWPAQPPASPVPPGVHEQATTAWERPKPPAPTPIPARPAPARPAPPPTTNRVHLGMAVATDEGLIVPVIWDADRKRMSEISGDAKELAKRARERKLKPEEFTGSTFSVSNLGMFGIDQFTAIINPPEAGILAIGTSEEKLVVVDGEPVVRSRVRVTMSCDHRVIDGAVGAKFLQTLRRLIENPLMLVY